jgi:hypothetical protein
MKLSERLKKENDAVIHLSEEGRQWWQQLIIEVKELETGNQMLEDVLKARQAMAAGIKKWKESK